MSDSVPHTLGAFTASFYYQHKRQPTPQEIFDAGMRGGRDLQWPTTVKSGWKFVPIVATQEMLEATVRTKPFSPTAMRLRQSVMRISAETWSEMIAVSPEDCGKDAERTDPHGENHQTSQLSIETILKLVACNTGKRVSLNLEELDQHIEFARAVEQELISQADSGNWAEAKCEPCGGEGSVHCSTSYGMSKQCVQCRGSGRAQLAGHAAEPKAKELVAWIRWFLRNVNDPDDFRWVKMQEAADLIESLIVAAPKLEVVGKIVGSDPVHGWHMQALKPWDEIGDGTVLYAAHPDDCGKDVFGPDTGCVRSDCIPGTCAAVLKEGDDALDARRHRYMRATTTAIRDPESGERIAVTPEMYDAAIDKAMADDPDATRGIKIKPQGDAHA